MNLDERTAEIRALLDEFADTENCTIQKKWTLAGFLARRLKSDSGRRFAEDKDNEPARDAETPAVE